MRNVVDALMTEGTLPDDSGDAIAALYVDEGARIATPWYIRALLGASAWIAAILLLIFLFGMGIINDEIGALMLGIVLCTTMVIVRRVAGSNLFLEQLALALSLTGQVLVIGGAGVVAESVSVGVLVTIILEVLLIVLYPDPLHRLLSTLAIIAALTVLVFEWEADLLLHALVIVAALATVVLWNRELELAVARMDEIVRPILYGLTLGLLGLVSLHVFDEAAINYWWLSTLGLMSILVMQVVQLLREYRVHIDRKLTAGLIITAVILMAAAINTPGLAASLIVLLLGFRHTNRLLLGLAVLFLIIFISTFYYMLSLTLLLKSLALIGSGVALFGLRWLARHLNLLGEVAI
jgi:uncharacterized membrane protein